MKKLLLLKSLLLLCALIVGSSAWAEDITYTLTITKDNFTTASYAANNNEKTTDAVCTTDATKKFSVSWTSYQVYQNSSAMQWQTNKGYIYNSTNLGTITNVAVTKTDGTFTTYYGTSAQPSSGTAGSGKGYFKTSVGGATGKTSQIVITFKFTIPTVTFGNGNVTEGETLDLRTLFSSNSEGDVTYTITSGDTYGQIESDGYTFTGLGEGSVTVKASQAAKGIYAAKEQSATITVVSASSPSVDITPTVLAFGEVEVGQTKNLTFTVTPANLTGDLTIASGNAKYIVSPTSIAQAITTAQTITVTAAPTAANDNMDGTITISGGGITSQTVTLSATPYVASTVSLVADPVGTGTFTYNSATVTSIDSKVGATITVTAVAADGYMFDGWTATGATIDNASNAETDFTLSSTTPTLTASFIVDPRKYTTLDDATIPAPAANVTYGTTQTFVKDGLTWVTTAYQPKDYATLQLNNTSGYIKLPVFSGKIVSMTFNVSGPNGTKKNDTSNKTDRKLKLFTSEDTSGEPVITSTNGSTNEITLDLTSLGSDYSTGYIRSSAALRIWEITVCYIPTDISVSVPSSKYTTFSDHVARDFSGTAVKAYKAKVNEGKVVLTQVDEVPANEGVILYCETAGNYDIPVASGTPAAVTENELIGVNARTLVEWETGGDGKKNYILQSGVFKKAADGGYLKANRAYLHTSYDVTTAGARDYLEFSFDDDVTGISDATRLNDNEKLINDNCFDLQGRKVTQPTKGLYIVNGKKVIIK